MSWNCPVFDSTGKIKDAALSSQGDAAVFFLSAESLPPDSYLTIYGFNLSSITDVKVNGKSQTIVNTAYDYDHLPLHPALMKLGKDTGVFDVDLTVDGGGEPTNTEKYQKIDVQLDDVVSGDTGIQFVGCGLITGEKEGYSLTDTISGFSVHTGNVYYVDINGDNSDPGTVAEPWATLAYALSNTSAGDAVYVRENATDWSTTAIIPSQSTSGTSSQPKLFSAYPGESPTWDSVVSADQFIDFTQSSGDVVSDLTFHGFSHVNSNLNGPSFITWRPPSGKRRIRFVANYVYGAYASASGAFCEVSGYGSSYATGCIDIRLIGNYCDQTSDPGLTNNNAHVYYLGGRSWTDGYHVTHCRNTRHGSGRIYQIYGHTATETISEHARNITAWYNNLEGAKQPAATNKPNVMLCSHADPSPWLRQRADWYEDVDWQYNSVSGGSTGMRVWQVNDADPGDDRPPILDAVVDNNVVYNCSGTDISLDWYLTANAQNNLTESGVSDLASWNGSSSTVNTNSTNYPGDLQ